VLLPSSGRVTDGHGPRVGGRPGQTSPASVRTGHEAVSPRASVVAVGSWRSLLCLCLDSAPQAVPSYEHGGGSLSG